MSSQKYPLYFLIKTDNLPASFKYTDRARCRLRLIVEEEFGDPFLFGYRDIPGRSHIEGARAARTLINRKNDFVPYFEISESDFSEPALMEEDSFFFFLGFDKSVSFGTFDFDYFPFTHIDDKPSEPFD